MCTKSSNFSYFTSICAQNSVKIYWQIHILGGYELNPPPPTHTRACNTTSLKPRLFRPSVHERVQVWIKVTDPTVSSSQISRIHSHA